MSTTVTAQPKIKTTVTTSKPGVGGTSAHPHLQLKNAPKIKTPVAHAEYLLEPGNGVGSNIVGRTEGFFSRASSLLQMFSFVGMFGGLLKGAGESEFINRNETVGNTLGKGMRFVGNLMSKPQEVSGYTPAQIFGSGEGSVRRKIQDKLEEKGWTGAAHTVETGTEKLALVGGKVTTGVGKVIGEVGKKYFKFEQKGIRISEAKQKLLDQLLALGSGEEFSNSPFATHATSIAELLGSVQAGDATAKTALEAIVKEVKDTVIEKGDKEGRRAQSKVLAYAQQVMASKDVTEALDRQERYYTDTENGLGESLQHKSLGELAFTAAEIAQMASTVWGAGTRYQQSMRALKMMVAELEGKKPEQISTFRILMPAIFGPKLPPAAQEARKQLLLGPVLGGSITVATTLGRGYITQLVDMLVGKQHTMIRHSAHMIAYMGINNAGRAFDKKFSISVPTEYGESLEKKLNLTEFYSRMKILEASGQRIRAESYLDLMVAISPEIRKDGGHACAYARELAMQFTMDQAPVAEVMQHLNKGRTHLKNLSQEIHPDIKAYMQERQAATQVETASETQSKEVVGEWTDKHLNGGGTQTKERKELGSLTRKLAAEGSGGQSLLGSMN